MNTVRETLIKQALGEIDELVTRLERIAPVCKDADNKLTETVVALENATDRYRAAVTAFTEQARDELASYLEQRAAQVKAKTTEEIKVIMQETAQIAFRSEAIDRAGQLTIKLADCVSELQKARQRRIVEIVFSAALAAALTLVGLFLFR